MQNNKIATEFDRHRLWKSLIFCAALVASIAVQFRVQILNHFSVLYGDRYDATIVATILEHWFNTLSGYSRWSEANYFYPHTNTLAQTDGYFITGLIYSVFRVVRFDPFIASEFTNVAIRAIGFAAFFVACRKVIKLPFSLSILGAILFVINNSETAHGQRLQLATVSFAPILAICIWKSCRALYACARREFVCWGAAAGMLVGAWSVTCFYMTWFSLYFFAVTLVAAIFCLGAARRRVLAKRIVEMKWAIGAVGLIFLISILPLLSAYLPKAKESGMRSVDSALANTVPLENVIRLGRDNLLFGASYDALLKSLDPASATVGEYYNTGVAPLCFILFVLGCILVFKNRELRQANGVLLPVVVATILTWISTLNVHGRSLWRVVYYGVPGAKALNVVAAYQIFILTTVIPIALIYLHYAAKKTPKPLILLLAALLCYEELNHGYVTLNRRDELQRVSLNAPIPRECSSFFVSGWKDQDSAEPMPLWINNYYAHNVTAMLIAEIIHVPTINGIASFNPPDWNFGFPNKSDYLQRMRNYAQSYGLKNMCKLDLDTKVWSTDW